MIYLEGSKNGEWKQEKVTSFIENELQEFLKTYSIAFTDGASKAKAIKTEFRALSVKYNTLA
jgi:hypothetical protein